MAASQNATRIFQQAFATQMVEGESTAGRFGRVGSPNGAGIHEVSAGAFGGTMSSLSRTATSASASDWFTYATQFTLAQKFVKHTIPKRTFVIDNAIADAGRQLADCVFGEVDAQFWAGMEGLFTAAHPRVGTGAGQVGASKKYIDTGLAYLAGEGGAGTQDNLLTSALSETSLKAAIKLLLNQKSDRGTNLHIGARGGLKLAVAPKNVDVAHELVRSMLSGSDMADNFLRGLIDAIVTYPLAADDDDWFLCSQMNTPVGISVDQAPMAYFSPSDDGLFVHLVATVDMTFWKAPYEHGLIGSNVA
jgi:hypothetical protein